MAADAGGRPLRPRQLLLLLSSVLAGFCTATLIMWRIFPALPTDVERLGVLIRALRGAGTSPQIVIFGNSAFMSGIDAAQLGRELTSSPVTWNLASTGQTLAESFLLTQELPATVHLAVYGIPFTAGSDASPLDPQKLNALVLYGYEPTEETKAVLVDIFGATMQSLLQRSLIANAIQSRWALRQTPDRIMRSSVRSDLDLERATFDLEHPQAYRQAIPRQTTDRYIARRLAALSDSPATVSDQRLALMRAISKDARDSGRRVVFLLPPIHPDLRRGHANGFDAATARVLSEIDNIPGALGVDATRLLAEEHFVDDVHPTNEGAVILTRFLAAAIQGL